MLLTVCAVTVPTAALNDSVNDSTWSEIELKALVYQEGKSFYSALAKGYENYDSGWKEIRELDDEERENSCSINIRGFCVSTPDGKYALMGHLATAPISAAAPCMISHPAPSPMCTTALTPSRIRALRRALLPTSRASRRTTEAMSTAASPSPPTSTWRPLGIAHINDETKQFEELWEGPVYQFGDQPGDANGIQVGINGVEVAKIGDKYYCYVMTNYAYDALYCFDVTNPSKPVLNTDFGTNGYINFSDDQCPVRTADSMLDDGYYLAVDTDGVVWLTAKLKSGKKALMKIAPDGASCVASYELENPDRVCHAGKYILVGNKNGQTIKVYNDDDMTEIATLKYEETYGTCITRIQVVDDILFIADGQENNESLANAILVAGLTPDAQAKIDSMAKKLAEGEATENLYRQGNRYGRGFVG